MAEVVITDRYTPGFNCLYCEAGFFQPIHKLWVSRIVIKYRPRKNLRAQPNVKASAFYVKGSSPICGGNSMVEFLPSKQAVAGSSPVRRSEEISLQLCITLTG